MVAQELLYQQRKLTPKKDQNLSAYEGKWVVLRDGIVIDSASDMTTLLEQGKLGDQDSVLRIPSHEVSFAF